MSSRAAFAANGDILHTSIIRLILALCLVPTLASSLSKVQAQTPVDSVERLHRADVQTSLDGKDMKPWHLKATFEILDANQHVTDNGSIEEWWTLTKHRIAITSKGYSSVEVLNDLGLYQTTGAAPVPYAIDLLRSAIVHPLPTQLAVSNSKPELRQIKSGTVPLDCIMLSQKIGVGLTEGREFGAVAPLGLFPTYCLDRDKNVLRFIADSGTQTVTMNSMGLFMGHSVAVKLSTQVDGRISSQAHIETLTGTTEEAGRYAETEGMSRVASDPVELSSSVLAGKLLSRPDPIYPDSAKAAHVAGTVLIRAIIGKDGHIRAMRLSQVPSPDLALAAMQAVKGWTYSPYLVNGQPVEVDTTISVHFTFGHR